MMMEQDMQVCCYCHKELSLNNFHKDQSRKRGVRSGCKLCLKKRWRVNLVSHRDYAQQYENRPDRKLARRKQRLLKRRGITLEEYEDRLALQGGRCAICRGLPSRGKSYTVDHDHQTGVVRGILCQKCNTGIGFFKDDPAIVTKAVGYLLEHSTT